MESINIRISTKELRCRKQVLFINFVPGNFSFYLVIFRHRKKGVSDSSDTNASDENSDFSRSANQFHEFPDVGVKTDVKSENDDNLALHGITLEPEPSFPKFNLRENILDLDRDKFLKEILSMKRRAKDRTYPRQEQPKKMFQTDHIKVQVNIYGGPHVNWVVVWSCVINQLWTASLFLWY